MTGNIKVSCTKDNLKTIREFVSDNLKNLVIDDSDLNLIVLAIDEVCSNLIIHSNQCDHNEFLEVNIKVKKQPEGVLFEIFDKGIAYNYSEYEEPSLLELIQKRRKGGLGLILVRKIMDQIEFGTENSMNVCRMFKKLAVA